MIYIMLPAYNEEDSISTCLVRIAGAMKKVSASFRIIVVNDGSRDKTLEVIERMAKDIPIEVISHHVNKGVGEVFRTGFTHISKVSQPDDIVVAMESDNTNDPSLLPLMIEKIEKEHFDIVCASRYISGGGYERFPFVRLVLSRSANVILRLLFRVPQVKDYTIFFRAYRAGILQKAINYYKDNFIESRGFVCNAEILIKLRAFATRCTEVPLLYRYDLKAGVSKLKIMKTVREYLKFLIKWRL